LARSGAGGTIGTVQSGERVGASRVALRGAVVRTAAPVVAGAVLSTGPLFRFESPSVAAVAVTALVWLPALARRRAPLAALLAAAAVELAWWAAHGLAVAGLLPAGVAAWWLLAGVADRCDRRSVAVGAAVCLLVPLGTAAGALAGRPGGAAIVPLSAFVVIAVLVGRNRRTRRDYLRALEDRAERAERERDQQARIAVVEERARIARELHDVVAHNLSVMTALADGAGYAPDPATARRAIAQVAATGRQALAEMHRLVGVLRSDDEAPELAPAPGLDGLDALVAQVRAAGLPTRLTVTGRPAPLAAGTQLAVHRLVQEALTNTLRHGRGVRGASVSMAWGPGELAVEVVDDGEPVVAPVRAGHGLVGMRERVAARGGAVEAGPRSGGGWRVAAVLPLADAAPAATPAAPPVPQLPVALPAPGAR
jgi:signal transduction histidine kinase